MIMKKLKERLTYLFVLAGLAAFMGTLLYIQADVWQECRQTNSFFYCTQLMGSK